MVNDQIFSDGNLLQAGDDVIDGGDGSDLLIGFAGDDTSTSDDGIADTVNGGPGLIWFREAYIGSGVSTCVIV